MDQEKETVEAFFAKRVPAGWFAGGPRVEMDDDEVLVTGELAAATPVHAFRASTRGERMAIATEGEERFGRKVSWGVRHEGRTTLFTTLGVPVMTRLRLPERSVLDTLIDGGIARSRSEAVSWCVKLVGRHEAEWLADLRSALVGVERVRAEGPTLL